MPPERRNLNQRACTMALLLMLLVGVSQVARAHAILVDSKPKLNSTVEGYEIEIALRFNVRIDAGRSRLRLVAPDGSVTTLATTAQSSPDTLKSSASILRPGAYSLRWQVLASDGHVSRGEIPFTVK